MAVRTGVRVGRGMYVSGGPLTTLIVGAAVGPIYLMVMIVKITVYMTAAVVKAAQGVNNAHTDGRSLGQAVKEYRRVHSV